MTAYVNPRDFDVAASSQRLVEASAPRSGFLAWVAGLVHGLLEQPRRSALIAELSALSDHELADIGLSRGNLHRVFEPDFVSGRARSQAFR